LWLSCGAGLSENLNGLVKVGFKVAHQQYPNKKTVLLFDGFPIKELLSELIMMILMRRM